MAKPWYRRLLKRILKSQPVENFLCRLGSVYISFCYKTTRWDFEGCDALRAHWADNKPFLIAFWHGRLMAMAPFWREGKGGALRMLISQHKDGEIIAKVVQPLGVDAVRGSSSRGAVGAVRTMAREVKAGASIGITPDGPRGPRMRAQNGVAAIAKLTGVPVIPVTWSTNNAKRVNSWDHMLVLKPFARGLFLAGEPIDIPKRCTEDELEAYRQLIEQRMIDLTLEADRRVGRAPIEPAAQSHEAAVDTPKAAKEG